MASGTKKTLVKIASLKVKGSSLARADERYIEIIAVPIDNSSGSSLGSEYRFCVERGRISNGSAMFLLPGSQLAIKHDADRNPMALYSLVRSECNGPDKVSKRPFYRFL